MTSERQPAARLAGLLGVVAVTQVCAAGVLTMAIGWSWNDAVEAFVVTNGLIGAAFAACGGIIGWHVPRNAVGWLFIAGGVAYATAALFAPATEALSQAGVSDTVLRLAVTVFSWSWPWAIALFIPLALLLFPDGRPPSPRWRPAVIAVIVTAPLFVLAWAPGTEPIAPHLPVGYPVLSWYDDLAPLWTAAEVRTLIVLALAVVALVVRYRRAAETERRQLLWLLLAAVVVVAVVVPWSFVAGTPILVLAAIPLIPLAVTVAIVRHRLLDIRLVVSRALAWIALSGIVVLTYVVLVAVLDRFVSARVGRSAVATVVIALLVAPVLPRLQRLVDRAMYGDRGDAARVAWKVAQQLEAGPTGSLPGVTAAVRHALRLPYVAVATPGSVVAADGDGSQATLQRLPLELDGSPVGELVVGLRPGERRLSPADHNVLRLATVPLAVALHAISLSVEVQRSRERIVAAREEERRRLRRDLHDGLGPTLTGVAFAADAVANRLDGHNEVGELLTAIRTDSRAAITDVRRLVDDLRPRALDELGLVGALRQRAEQMPWSAEGIPVSIVVHAPDDLVDLPAAVEVAAYRIGTEAMTNVLRHSSATRAVVTLTCADTLDLEIVDNGCQRTEQWTAGVGLRAMRERVDELGGRLEAGPTAEGGRVAVSLPLGRA